MQTRPFVSESKAPAHSGFTLVELLVVMGIIALLSAMTISAFTYATKKAALNRTEATFAGIKLGLAAYNKEYNGYPEPANGELSDQFGGKRYTTGGAAMLYQAMSGDGTDQIQIGGSESSGSSDGQFDKEESARTMMRDMPVTTWKKVGSVYMMVDGFGKPFQYTYGGDQDAVMTSSYDLWSFGEDEQNTTNTSRAAKIDPNTNVKWIKNW